VGLRSAGARPYPLGVGRYTTPRPSSSASSRSRRRTPLVRGPGDLVFSDQVPAPEAAAEPRALAEVRERAASLEGALAKAVELERRANDELTRVREDRREEVDRLRGELTAERERHATEVGELRGRLEIRERELRTLALEMGKTQGRLEVAERRLIESHSTPSASPAVAAGTSDRWQTRIAVAVLVVVGLFGLRFVAEEIGYRMGAADEVRATQTVDR
jgi:chaperonin cofactor prefoldin